MDSLTFKMLQLFNERNHLTIKELSTLLNIDWIELYDPINALKSKNYIRVDPDYATLNNLDPEKPYPTDAPLTLRFEGRVALETEQKARKRLRIDEVRAWATLAIAFAALLISFFTAFNAIS